MLILRRFSIIIGIVLVGMISVTLPALADNGWGNTICEQTPVPACDLGAGSGGERPRGGPGPGERGARRPDAGSPRDERTLGDGIVGGDANLADCAYVRSDYQPPASGGAIRDHSQRRSQPTRAA